VVRNDKIVGVDGKGLAVKVSMSMSHSIELFGRSTRSGLQDFIPCFKVHLLARLKVQRFNGNTISFSNEERRSIKSLDGTIYSHQGMRVYYTAYDMRRDQNSFNPQVHADILVSSYDDSTSPPSTLMWHARVIGVYWSRPARLSRFLSYMYDALPMTRIRPIEVGIYNEWAFTMRQNRPAMH
jgi:hypothetical protein